MHKLEFKDRPDNIEKYIMRKLSNDSTEIIITHSDKNWWTDVHPQCNKIEDNYKNYLLCFQEIDDVICTYEIHIPYDLCNWYLSGTTFNYYKDKDALHILIYPDYDYKKSIELAYEKFI